MEDKNKFAVLLNGDNFGPKAVFVGDEVRYIVPDTTSSSIAEVLEIPSESIVKIIDKNYGTKTIYRDRITYVFPKFK